MKNTLQFIFILLASGIFSTGFAQNNCLDFDGTEDYIDCGSAINSSTDNQITLSAWVYPEFNAFGDRGIVTNYWYSGGAKGGAGLFAWTSGVSPSTDHIWYGMISNASGGIASVGSSFLMTLNQWTHVAMTYDNNTLRLFVNGEEVATNNCGSGYLTDPTNNNPFYIAKHSYSSFCFNSKIDEVEIWNDARTPQEIRQNMYRELPNPSGETNLVAYYKFNESSGTTLTDSKGSNNGTLTNMAGNEWTASMTLTGTSNALDFDGTEDYVLLDDRTLFTGLTALTVEAWVYSTASSGWHEIFQVYPNNITLALSGTGLYAFMNDNAEGTQNSISIAKAEEIKKRK